MVQVIDFIPGPIYRFFYWLKTRPRHIKWWFQRANGKLPDCDIWNYNDTLILHLEQGLSYLLGQRSHTDWQYNKEWKKIYDELNFALSWIKEYKTKIYGKFYIIDDIERHPFNNDSIVYFTPEEWKNFEKRKEKSFRIIAKYLHTLWD